MEERTRTPLFLLPSVQMFLSIYGGGLLVGRVSRENDTYAAHSQFCRVYLTQSLVIGAIVVQDAAQFILQGLLFTRKGFDGKRIGPRLQKFILCQAIEVRKRTKFRKKIMVH